MSSADGYRLDEKGRVVVVKGFRVGGKGVGMMVRHNVRGHRLEDRRCDPQLST